MRLACDLRDGHLGQNLTISVQGAIDRFCPVVAEPAIQSQAGRSELRSAFVPVSTDRLPRILSSGARRATATGAAGTALATGRRSRLQPFVPRCPARLSPKNILPVPAGLRASRRPRWTAIRASGRRYPQYRPFAGAAFRDLWHDAPRHRSGRDAQNWTVRSRRGLEAQGHIGHSNCTVSWVCV